MRQGEDRVVNRSGVPQIYYTKAGNIQRVEAGDSIPLDELKDLGESQMRSMLEVFARPCIPRRPVPKMMKLVPALNAEGVFVPISVRATLGTKSEYLRDNPTIVSDGGLFPGWIRHLVSTDTRSSSRFKVRSGQLLGTGTESDKASRLVSAIRATLNGTKVPGIKMLSGRPLKDGKQKPLVVLCVHNALRHTLECIWSIEQDSDRPDFDLVVVNDGSEEIARNAIRAALRVDASETTIETLETEGVPFTGDYGVSGTYVERLSAQGYLRSANQGASFYDPEKHNFVVFLNSDTVVGRGWLRSLHRALYSADDVGAANPLSNNNVNYSVKPPAGSDPSSFSDSLILAHDGTYPEVLAPSGFCLAVRGEVWSEYGPYDEAQWGTGYGEETDIMLASRKHGKWRHVLAPDSYVHHARSMSHSREAGTRKSHDAFRKICEKYGSFVRDEAIRIRESESLDEVSNMALSVSRLPGVQSKDQRKSIAWFVRSSNLCGGVYACIYLSQALKRRGWDSRVVTVLPRDADMYDNVTPMTVFDGEADVRSHFADEVFSEGFVVSASWVTAPIITTISDRHPGIKPVLFVQDDERRFDFNGPYKRIIETAWETFDSKVTNSAWVDKSVADYLGPGGAAPKMINVGFDSNIFYPRSRDDSDSLRIIAMTRAETTHRGTDILLEALRIAKQRGANVELTFFGSRPSTDLEYTYAGRINHHELAPILARQDVLIDPSRFQGFGLDAVQALASGVALICTDNLGCDEYAKDGENSLIVPPTPEGIAEAIVKLSNDKDELARLQQAGPDSVRHLDWDVLAEQWESYLLSI